MSEQPKSKSKIVADNIKRSYGKREIVKGVSLEVNQGEIVGLLGPNGAGKTTTFYMIVGIVSPIAGKVYFDKEDMTRDPIYKRARRGIGYLAQEASIFRNLTVEENISLAIELKYKKDKAKIASIVKLMLEEFRITHIAKSKGYALSGGERRRVEIARAIALEPKFILLDEPFAGVDPHSIKDIQEVIVYLKKRGLGILITDHNVRETLSITDRSYILSNGSLIVSGTSQEIANNPLAKEVYLGEDFKL